VARATVVVGGSNWTLVASARHPFIGTYVHSLSTIILLLGLLIALIAGGTIEVLHRRHRYARALVDERTADLELSLQNLEEAHASLVRGERLTAIGEMAGVVGHELRNPLAAVTNALFLIRNEVSEPMSDLLARNLAMAERETAKAATLADDLTAFVRPREMDKRPIPVGGLVDEVLSVAPPPTGVELITDVEDFTLVADRGQMAEILTNLVTNAYEAIPGGGTLRIRAGHMSDGMRLVVEDSGPGIDESVAHRITEPFFTTKYSGTGLGLAIVHRLVLAHGGSIEFGNAAGGGARVTVLIPNDSNLVST
jgi:signal transduction histidine kinase